MTTEERTEAASATRAGGPLLAAAAVLWAAGMHWAAWATIARPQAAEAEVTSAAYALPGAISATLVAGAAVALAVLRLLGARVTSPTGRLGVGAGTGLLVGVLAGALVVLAYPPGWVYAVMAGCLAAAAIVGGAVAGIRTPQAVAAGAWGTLAVFLLGAVLSLFSRQLLPLFGSGSTDVSQLAATERFMLVQAFAGGLLAAVVAFGHLRGSTVRWPAYGAAGAGAGLALFAAELLARTAGGRVLDLAGRVSPADLVVQELLAGSRLSSALVVLFVGAIGAIILVGRTLKPASE
jgi:hypothetical protein